MQPHLPHKDPHSALPRPHRYPLLNNLRRQRNIFAPNLPLPLPSRTLFPIHSPMPLPTKSVSPTTTPKSSIREIIRASSNPDTLDLALRVSQALYLATSTTQRTNTPTAFSSFTAALIGVLIRRNWCAVFLSILFHRKSMQCFRRRGSRRSWSQFV